MLTWTLTLHSPSVETETLVRIDASEVVVALTTSLSTALMSKYELGPEQRIEHVSKWGTEEGKCYGRKISSL